MLAFCRNYTVLSLPEFGHTCVTCCRGGVGEEILYVYSFNSGQFLLNFLYRSQKIFNFKKFESDKSNPSSIRSSKNSVVSKIATKREKKFSLRLSEKLECRQVMTIESAFEGGGGG
jgi:hypothetical protein